VRRAFQEATKQEVAFLTKTVALAFGEGAVFCYLMDFLERAL
ncbi:MAG: hypothetical protein RL257_469, partial [Actinomycetota bacterium]